MGGRHTVMHANVRHATEQEGWALQRETLLDFVSEERLECCLE